MYEVTTRTTAPYASVVYIESDWADGTASRASGVVVGPNDVLTALHVVFEAAHGGWATRVVVIPAVDTQPWFEPYGEFMNVASMVGRAANWDLNGDGLLTSAESAGDLAVLGLTTRLGDATGWLPVAQQATDFAGVMAGYPARGTGLMAEQVNAHVSPTQTVYTVDSGLGPGASGGPLLATVGGATSVVGVLSGGNATSTSSTYAGLFSAATWTWLQGAMQANDGLLSYRATTAVPTSHGLSLTGSGADDTLTGSDGPDVLTGAGGNDTLLGGAGIDVAVYSGARSQYQVSVQGTTITVVDTLPGRDGHDTLHDVERLKFADGCLAFDTGGAAGEAYRLYQTVFGREPDAAGLGFHMAALDNGDSLRDVAADFVNSPEYAAHGTVNDEQFVQSLYVNALHRAADAPGLAFHLASLAAGASRADVVVTFSESPEQQADLVGLMGSGIAYAI